ncbi:MAG TPA: hypothetical protein DEF42_13050 [Desulfosporosinus sp.]|nr:hypothetical protein [Desulfosporosinus sp.]
MVIQSKKVKLKNLKAKREALKEARKEKYWAFFLPVTTAIAVVNSLFWDWLILYTMGVKKGHPERLFEDQMIEQF